jgi:putative transposase
LSGAYSLSAKRPYGVERVCTELGLQRSTYYAASSRQKDPSRPKTRRGPRTKYSDAELTEKIRTVLERSGFVGEGHRKAWARLRLAGIRASKARVLRLMRQANLLAPVRARRVLGPRAHEGRITTDRPDEMWGTDGTTTVTTEDVNSRPNRATRSRVLQSHPLPSVRLLLL